MAARSKLPEWKYLERKNDGKIYCKFCNNTCGTSVTRARDHLLGIVGGTGGGVAACTKIDEDVKKRLSEEVNAHKQGKVVQEARKKRTQDTLMGRENVINSTPSSFLPFVASTTSSMPYGSQREPTLPDVDPTQQTLEKAWKPLERNEVADAVYDFFIGCNIS